MELLMLICQNFFTEPTCKVVLANEIVQIFIFVFCVGLCFLALNIFNAITGVWHD